MGTCFLASITEARGIDLTAGENIGSVDPSALSGAVNASVKEAFETSVNSDEIRLSGND